MNDRCDNLRRPLEIAVVGTGIAGMSAAWLLSQSHRVTVYEKADRLGGHSNTVEALTRAGNTAVDTGFIVYNETNYPNLTALFHHLKVPTEYSNMSFAASLRGGSLEYAGTDLDSLFGQRKNLVSARFWRTIMDIMRFYREAPKALVSGEIGEQSLGEYLQKAGYGDALAEDHLLPMGAAIWSTTSAEMKAYPAASFLRFFLSHGLMQVRNRPQWRTVTGGSREYVRRLTAPFADRVCYGGAMWIKRKRNGVTVRDFGGISRRFDHVVLAAHADESLALLCDPSPSERMLLGAWRYTRNRAVLHRDASLMPKRKRVWSSWNFIGAKDADAETALCVTYWMNRLQNLDTHDNLFLTLNPLQDPTPGSVICEMEYDHPFFDLSALNSQRQLWRLQGDGRTWYCGSYFGHGFHEDALQSGLAVAEQLGGVRRPWEVKGESGRIFLSSTTKSAA